MVFRPAIPTSDSSSATPEVSCRTPAIEWLSTISVDTGRSPADVLDDFAGFYFDTALSSSAAALPTLLAFAKPGHITFGSDWPYRTDRRRKAVRGRAWRPTRVSMLPLATAIERTNALALFPRLGAAAQPISQLGLLDRLRRAVSRPAMRGAARMMSSSKEACRGRREP